MKRKSLGIENLEQRTVLSASAVVAVEQLAADDAQNAQIEAVSIKPAQDLGGHNAIETRSGDFNLDGDVDAVDIDMLCVQMQSSSGDMVFDLNQDGAIDKSDMDMLIRDIIGTEYGDSNLDGAINGFDAATMFTHMFTETSGWEAGDFSCDGVIDGQDFIAWNQFKFTVTKLGTGDPGPAEVTHDSAKETTTLEAPVAETTTADVAVNSPAVTNVATTARPIMRTPQAAAMPVVRETAMDAVMNATDDAQPVAQKQVATNSSEAATVAESSQVAATESFHRARTNPVDQGSNGRDSDGGKVATTPDQTLTAVAADRTALRLRFARLRRGM